MKTQIQLTFDESLALESILILHTERAKHAITLPYLMDKWSQFVTKVEEGYRLTIDDYTNSLSIRNLLQEILDACPKNIGLKEWIDEWDNRLVKVTEQVEEPLLHPLNGEHLGWWWFRIPINPGNELKKWFQVDRPK